MDREPTASTVVFFSDYGPLGKVSITLPQTALSDQQFDEEFAEILAFVRSAMRRRKDARRPPDAH
jgi:hypothetical protein